MKKAVSIFTLLVISLSTSFIANADPTYSSTNPGFPKITVDPAVPSQYALGMCITADQLDCINSVDAKIGSGPFVPAIALGDHAWTTEIENGVVVHKLQTQNSGAPWEPQETVWQLPNNGLKFMVGAGVNTFGATSEHLGVMGAYAGGFADEGLPMDFSVRISIRTSWIRAQNLQFNAVSAVFSQTSITGGNLWTFSGSPAKIATYTDEKYQRAFEQGWMEQADGEDRWLGFTIHHAGPTADLSWWDPTCADEGYIAQAFNSSAAGSPDWNYQTNSLEFNIFAPHLTVSGEQNTGFFRLWVDESFAECQWPGNTLVSAEKLEALIVNEDGSLQDAQVSVTKENGVIYLDAGEFHYSVPQFVIRASTTRETPPQETPTYTAPNPTANKPSQVASITRRSSNTQDAAANPSSSPSVKNQEDTMSEEPLVAESAPAGGSGSDPGPLLAFGIGAAVIFSGVTLEILRRRQLLKSTTRRR